MVLRDLGSFHQWLERGSPSFAAQRVVRHFLAEIGDEPWRAPSIPIDELSNWPESEVCTVNLEVAGEQAVRIYYRHFFANDAVDLVGAADC